jgi:phage baseplate assembly protein W
MENNVPIKKSFLGTGWAFPITFIRNCGPGATTQAPCEGDEDKPGDFSGSLTVGDTVKTQSEVKLIEQSLTILLSTKPGERVMRPDYGCALDDILFEPANTSLLTYIKDTISKSILYYEPRVQVRSIDIITDHIVEGRVLVELDLIVRSTNSRYNYVFDFYQREATIKPI